MEKNSEVVFQSDSEKLDDNASTKKQSAERFKTTLYLTKEAEYAYTELYIRRLRKDRKTDKSKVVNDALIALYEKECLEDRK